MRASATIVLVLAVLAAAWWGGRAWLRPRDVAPSPVAPAGAVEVRAAAASAPVVAAQPSDRTARVAAGAAAPGPEVVVRVVAASGVPAVGAVVHFVDPQESVAALAALAPTEQRALRCAAEQRLVRLGTRLVAGADGVVRWPHAAVARRYWHAIARAGAELGETWIARDAAPEDLHELRLQPDVSASVRVLDTRHQPVAGIDVIATFAALAEIPYRARHALGTSDEAGEVRVHHVQLWRERIAPIGAARPALLAVDLPGVAPGAAAMREIDTAALPREPIVLFVPPTGAIDVLALDGYGAPRPNERIALRVDGAGPEDHGVEAVTDAAGTVSFARVGLDHAWRVGFATGDAKEHRLVVGPSVAGERVLVRLQPAPSPMLTGRLLRDGEPAAGVALALTADGKPAGVGTPRTDALGRFRVAVAPALADRRVRELGFDVPRRDPLQPGARGVWRGDLRLTLGEHALGDVVLEVVAPAAVLVAGVLTGVAGAPPPRNARIGIQAKAPGDAEWRWAAHVQQQPDGAFLATGDAPPGELRLFVFGTGFVPVPPVPFAAGARGVRIELRRGGSLRATALVGTPIAAHCLEPLLVPVATDAPFEVLVPFDPVLDPRVPGERRLAGDEPLEQTWVWPALAPGRYRLDVWARGAAAPLLSVADLIVRDGERNEDPRSQRLQLTALRTVELSVSLPKDTPEPRWPDLGVVFVFDGDRPAGRCVQLDSRLAHLVTAGGLDVLVRVPGCRDRVVRGITGDTTVALEPGIAVTLRSAAPAAGEGITWTLVAADDPLAAARVPVYSPASGGTLAQPFHRAPRASAPWTEAGATLRVPAPGRYRLTATVQGADGAERRPQCVPEELAVPETGASVEVALR